MYEYGVPNVYVLRRAQVSRMAFDYVPPQAGHPPPPSRPPHALENVSSCMLRNFELQNGGELVWYGTKEDGAWVAGYTVGVRTVGSTMYERRVVIVFCLILKNCFAGGVVVVLWSFNVV